MKILWKGTVSAEFRVIRLKLCGNCAFPQNFHISKLGEITVFFAVLVTLECPILMFQILRNHIWQNHI